MYQNQTVKLVQQAVLEPTLWTLENKYSMSHYICMHFHFSLRKSGLKSATQISLDFDKSFITAIIQMKSIHFYFKFPSKSKFSLNFVHLFAILFFGLRIFMFFCDKWNYGIKHFDGQKSIKKRNTFLSR